MVLALGSSLARRNYNSKDYESDSEEELSVSEGELEWLEQDLETVIAKEDPKAKTLDLLKAVQINLHEVRGKPGRKKSLKKGDKPGYEQRPSQPSDFRRMKGMLAKFEAQGYDSDSDADYHPGDEVEEVDDTDGDETTTEGGDSSFCGNGQKKKRRARGNTETSAVSSHASKDVSTSTTLSEENPKENKKMGNLPFWVVACSLPEVYDTELGKFIPVDRNYNEEQDPDYKLPEDDKDWLSDLEELEEVEDNLEEEVKCLVEDAAEPAPERDDPGVVSPVKVVLTPAKDLSDEKGVAADEEDEEVTLVDDGEVKLSRKPLLWEVELLMTEQKEDYDEDQDPEYVPPPTCADISLDYDEFVDGETEIDSEELQELRLDMQTPPSVPSDYIAVWVKVDSPMERAAKAKEELQHINYGAGSKDKEEVTDRSDDDDVTEKVAGGKANLAISGSRRQKSSSSKNSCGDAEAFGKLEDGHVMKQSPVDVLGSQNQKEIRADGDSLSAAELSKDAAQVK